MTDRAMRDGSCASDSVTQAVQVLNATTHRGARDWVFDSAAQRVMPAEWNERGFPPAFTPFEVVAVARRLVEIGAVPA